MKRVVMGLVALLVVLAIAAGVFTWVSYNRVDEDSVPQPAVTVGGVQVAPQVWEWHTPVVGGLLYKDFEGGSRQPVQLGTLAEGAGLGLALPEGCEITLVLSHNGTQTYNGPAAGLTPALMEQPGSYALAISCLFRQQGRQAYGSFLYTLDFAVPAPPAPAQTMPTQPTLQLGRTQLQQGDIFAMRLLGIAPEITPTAQTDLGFSYFMPMGDGSWYCTVPIGNTRELGDYAVTVTAGENTWQETVTVLEYDFPKQNLDIDLTDPVITEANSAEAYEQYRQKIPPLFNTYDEQIYWEGLFIRPVEGGYISTEFGSIRITNGDPSTARSHWGMDFAVGEGSPISAPNNGRVVLAEYLLNTGWTIVIEHGGGLKSYYFHMSEIHVEVEDMVKTGDLIGKVGSTGYSTGPHLHFEMRIGNQAVSPSMLFETTAGLYTALPEEEE